jgi:hypothetical protein
VKSAATGRAAGARRPRIWDMARIDRDSFSPLPYRYVGVNRNR